MFRVPSNPIAPTFDHTFKVSMLMWLTSKSPARREWRRRRDAAAQAARRDQNARGERWARRRFTDKP
jgi:hypothetical protein